MALGPVHCGSFLLFAAFVLLLIATISAPIIHRVSFLDITGQGIRSTFGTFGYCLDVNEGGVCSRAGLGYNIVSASTALFDHEWTSNTVQTLTKALILHPIACGLTFLSLLVSVFSDRLGYIFSALLALLAFLVTLAVLIIDFVVFGIIKREVNDNSQVRQASYANAIWMVLAATVVLFFAMFIVLFSCCTARKNRRTREADTYGRGGGYDAGGYVGNGAPPMSYAPQKKHFWQRSQKY